METLVPSRTQISERFPIASFDVNVPESRFFEVACATDPRLFHTDWRARRTQKNFYTTRGNGLLRAPRGRTTWLMPSDQLKRFAGARRVYYALASYGGPSGGDARFSISPQSLDAIPSIGLASDFTGRSLDRTRLGWHDPAPDAYGAVEPNGARWGGDDAFERERESRTGGAATGGAYDDGFGGELWTGDGETQPARKAIPAARSGNGSRRIAGLADYDDPDEPPEDDADEAPPSATGQAVALGDDDPEYEAENEDDFDSVYGVESSAPDFAGSSVGADEEDEDYNSYDDPQGIYGAVAYHVGGGGGASVLDAPVDPGLDFEEPAGKDSDYWDEESGEDPELTPALSAVVFDIPEQIRVLRIVGRAEGGAAGYSAVNADSEFNTPGHRAYQKYHIGLSWGFIQFTQRSGALGRVLKAARKRELRTDERIPAEQQMPAVFGPAWEQLLDVTTAKSPDARLAPVDKVELWREPWLARFKAAGALDHMRAAQNEVAIGDYLEPVLNVAQWLRVFTPRGISMILDRSINMGVQGGLRWILDAIGPIRTDEDRSACLRALGKPDLAAFQTVVPGLPADGKWGPSTHAAMISALRDISDHAPVPVPTPGEILQGMVDGAKGRSFEKRLRRLYENQSDFDDTVEYALL